MDSGLPPGKPGQPSGVDTRVIAGGLVRQGGYTSRAAAIESISESIIGIHDSLHDCPVDVVEHVAFLVNEAALAVANSLRCDRLAVQEASAPSPAPSYASEGSNCESQELAEEEPGSQRSVSVSFAASPTAGGLTPTAEDEQPVTPPTEGSPLKVLRRRESLGSAGSSNNAAEREERDRPPKS